MKNKPNASVLVSLPPLPEILEAAQHGAKLIVTARELIATIDAQKQQLAEAEAQLMVIKKDYAQLRPKLQAIVKMMEP